MFKYFTYEEFIYSATALKYGIRNRTTKEVEANIEALVHNILDPLRQYIGKPINVTSGFRCKALNDATANASKTSQHMTGQAADITVGSKTGNRTMAKIIASKYMFDQLVDENDYRWIHVSFNPHGVNRGQILRIRNGKTQIITADKL